MNPYVDLQPLIELEELLDEYGPCLFGVSNVFGLSDSLDDPDA